MNDIRIDDLASEVMDSSNPSVESWHRLAANAAKTAAMPTLDQRTRDIYRMESGKGLLQAVFIAHPELSTADMLKVAANIAERADA